MAARREPLKESCAAYHAGARTELQDGCTEVAAAGRCGHRRGRTLRKRSNQHDYTLARGAATFGAGAVAAWRVRVPPDAPCRRIFLGVASPATVAAAQPGDGWPREESVVMRADTGTPAVGAHIAV
jgi:hypothetical protein